MATSSSAHDSTSNGTPSSPSSSSSEVKRKPSKKGKEAEVADIQVADPAGEQTEGAEGGNDLGEQVSGAGHEGTDARVSTTAAVEPTGDDTGVREATIPPRSADDAGQDPPSLSQDQHQKSSSSSTALETAAPPTTTSSSPAPAGAVAAGPESTDDADKEKDKGSLNTTLTASQAHTHSRRKTEPTTSEAAQSSTIVAHNGVTATKSKASTSASKKSFLSKIFRALVPCIGKTDAHEIDLDVESGVAKEDRDGSTSGLKEKGVVPPIVEEPQDTGPKPETAVVAPEPTTADKLVATETPPLEALVTSPLALEPVAILTPSPTDSEVIVPPTPTKLLPEEETEGVTSGAVQAPGSTGEEGHAKHRTHDHDASMGEESDKSSFDDEPEEDMNQIDEVEDEEDRLIMAGGAGIPIGPDGTPRPLLPPVLPQHVGRKCLVLDLDETLVHSSFKSIQQADYVVPVEIEYHWHNVYVIKRPGVDNFLKKMGEIYEVVVFTASLSKYADPVLDKLDIHRVVSHRLFRESCYNHRGNYVKDLSQLGRPIADTIILDNSPASYIFHPNNAVPVSSWFNDPHDTELTDLCPFLADLATVDDVRGVLDGGL